MLGRQTAPYLPPGSGPGAGAGAVYEVGKQLPPPAPAAATGSACAQRLEQRVDEVGGAERGHFPYPLARSRQQPR